MGKGPAAPPEVRLGRVHRQGLSPSMFGLIERGIIRRPAVARGVRGRVVFRFKEDFVPLRVSFGPELVVVEDGDLSDPDLVISGRLPDIIHFAASPLRRGLPDPISRRGRRAIVSVASRRVRLSGDRGLALGVLALLALED